MIRIQENFYYILIANNEISQRQSFGSRHFALSNQI